jgi:hypothetical protein
VGDDPVRSVSRSFVVSLHAVAVTRFSRAAIGGLRNRSIALMIAYRHRIEKLSGRRSGLHCSGGRPYDLSPSDSDYAPRFSGFRLFRIDVAINR